MSKEKQIEEMAKDLQKSEHWYFNDHSVDFELDRKKTAENLYNTGYRKQSDNVIPCKVGQTVYKICPKCNEKHNGSCDHCAWRGCFMTGCDVGVRVYFDGSNGDYNLQIIPYKVSENRFVTIIKYWNIMFFATAEEAETAKSEYDTIRKIEDRQERYKTYKEWETKREKHYAFLKGGEE